MRYKAMVLEGVFIVVGIIGALFVGPVGKGFTLTQTTGFGMMLVGVVGTGLTVGWIIRSEQPDTKKILE